MTTETSELPRLRPWARHAPWAGSFGAEPEVYRTDVLDLQDGAVAVLEDDADGSPVLTVAGCDEDGNQVAYVRRFPRRATRAYVRTVMGRMLLPTPILAERLLLLGFAVIV